MEIDKSVMKDDKGRMLTQSLFLEIGYSSSAVYTLKEEDHEYEGKIIPSIKKLYLECSDPTEYVFANKYFLNWRHWQRITENKVLLKYINEWRDELEIKIRSDSVRQMMANAKAGKVEATKWIAQGSWKGRGAGRPSKAEIERQKKIDATISSEFEEDVIRLINTK